MVWIQCDTPILGGEPASPWVYDLVMCERYVSPDSASVVREYPIDRCTKHSLLRNADARPSNPIPVVLRKPDGATILAVARWGLVPSWWSQVKLPELAFNARSADAAEKTMWRYPWRHTRCLIPAEGWYEWRTAVNAMTGETQTNSMTKKAVRQKYHVRSTGAFIFFAGLYSPRATRDDCDVSAAIVTRAARGPIAWLHDRMPCVLNPATIDAWLNPAVADSAEVRALLAECREDFEATAV